jgi:RNA polymerase sigma-70 factor (ECF subfamily)
MGVLHMAIPTAGMIPRQPRLRGYAAAQTFTRPKAATAGVRGGAAGSQALLSGTLLPSGDTSSRAALADAARPRHEVTLQRTPEQEAEQEALGKLVRQCIAGDQQAWQQLVAGQHRRIYAICYRFTGSATDAEDLTQDVFLKLYRNLASFDTQKGSFQTWITTLARNLLVDHFRRTRMDRASDSLDASLTSEEDGATLADRLADPRPSQEAHASGLELKARIQQALAQLSPELREAVVFRDLEDMDYKEIAQVLRIPEGTVKSRISRGRGELARLLQRIEGQVV